MSEEVFNNLYKQVVILAEKRSTIPGEVIKALKEKYKLDFKILCNAHYGTYEGVDNSEQTVKIFQNLDKLKQQVAQEPKSVTTPKTVKDEFSPLYQQLTLPFVPSNLKELERFAKNVADQGIELCPLSKEDSHLEPAQEDDEGDIVIGGHGLLPTTSSSTFRRRSSTPLVAKTSLRADNSTRKRQQKEVTTPHNRQNKTNLVTPVKVPKSPSRIPTRSATKKGTPQTRPTSVGGTRSGTLKKTSLQQSSTPSPFRVSTKVKSTPPPSTSAKRRI